MAEVFGETVCVALIIWNVPKQRCGSARPRHHEACRITCGWPLRDDEQFQIEKIVEL
jgi:hypothetical protein